MLALWTAVTLCRPFATAYSKANRAIRSDALAGDDLDALGRVAADHVLDAGVEVLGVLADDHEVDVLVAGLDARPSSGPGAGWRTARAPGGAPTLTLRKPPPTGVVIGPLSATLLRRIDSRTRVRERRARARDRGLARLDGLPLEADARRVEDAGGRLRQLRTDAVAGDQGDSVGHGRDSSDAAGTAAAGSQGGSRPSRMGRCPSAGGLPDHRVAQVLHVGLEGDDDRLARSDRPSRTGSRSP